MRCTQCGYVSMDGWENCPQCDADLQEHGERPPDGARRNPLALVLGVICTFIGTVGLLSWKVVLLGSFIQLVLVILFFAYGVWLLFRFFRGAV